MADGLIKSSRKTPTKFDNGYEPTFDSDGTPTCLGWKIEDVADWVEFLGFPQYRVRQKLQSSAQNVSVNHIRNWSCFIDCPQACFRENLINGRKLITVDASSLPRMGVTDFEHIKVCVQSISKRKSFFFSSINLACRTCYLFSGVLLTAKKVNQTTGHPIPLILNLNRNQRVAYA